MTSSGSLLNVASVLHNVLHTMRAFMEWFVGERGSVRTSIYSCSLHTDTQRCLSETEGSMVSYGTKTI